MKRNLTTRMASIVLALLFALCAMPTATAASAPYTYVALGDSIAAGYGLNNASQGYVSRLSGLIGATNVYNLARSGMTSDQVLLVLQDPDAISVIQSANLITVSAGCADVLGAFIDAVTTAAGTNDYTAILTDPAKLAAVAQALNSAQTQAKLQAAIQSAVQALPQIAAAIRQINPNAKLVFTNAYNPYEGVVVPGETPLNLGAIADQLVLALNQSMSAVLLTGASVVDVYSRFQAPGTPICVNVALAPTVNFDPHPNATGHGLIAELIYKEVKGAFPAIKVPARVGTSTKKLTVYKKAGKTKMFELAKGSSVVIFSWDGQYAKIGFNNGYGYVKTASLTMIPLMAEPTKRMNVRTKAPVRLEPGKSNDKLGTVYPRNQLVAYATSGKWTKVQFGAQLGYVETKYLTKAK